MNIIDFINYFPDEETCEIHLKEHREKAGIRCKSCGDITRHTGLAGQIFRMQQVPTQEFA